MQRWDNRRWDRRMNKTKITKLILIGVFLVLSYLFYTKNVLDVGFTTLIQLPLINKVVEGYIYWIVVAVACYFIWKIVDWLR